jgi:hypothetical protein
MLMHLVLFLILWIVITMILAILKVEFWHALFLSAGLAMIVLGIPLFYWPLVIAGGLLAFFVATDLSGVRV